jgi:hypothetical protein
LKSNIFQKDESFFARKLAFHKKRGTFLKLITFGIFKNNTKIQEYSNLYEKCRLENVKYDEICKEIDELDSLSETLTLNGIRVSKHTFSDISVINPSDYGINWDVLRLDILDRDSYECCEEDGYCKGSLQIHHIIPLSRGGTSDSENLQTLCRYHHSLKHNHMGSM